MNPQSFKSVATGNSKLVYLFHLLTRSWWGSFALIQFIELPSINWGESFSLANFNRWVLWYNCIPGTIAEGLFSVMHDRP